MKAPAERIRPKTIFITYFFVLFVYSIVSNIVWSENFLRSNSQVLSRFVMSLLPNALLDGLIIAFVITAVYWLLCWFLDSRSSKKKKYSETSQSNNPEKLNP